MNKNLKFNRYHSDVYFPESFPEMVLEFIETFNGEINLTDHAAEQMYEDKRGMIPLPDKKEMLHSSNKIVEFYEKLDYLGRIQKAVFRIGYLNENFDYTYVVARGGVIVTCWANSKTDTHRLTESREKYYCPPELKDKVYAKLDMKEKTYIKADNK